MKSFAKLPVADRLAFVQEAAARLGVLSVIVEKDFWVCWTLWRIFKTEKVAPYLVFKGGTSLSKVFGAIQRFSEDIDLSVAPTLLGWEEAELDDAPSSAQRRKRQEKLEAACIEKVQGDFLKELQKSIKDELGEKSDGAEWLTFQFDAASKSPVLLFTYPGALAPVGGYIQPIVKMEFGSLTDQRPTGIHSITPMLSQAVPGDFEDFKMEVVALEVERTFWEKATILHAEHHRPEGQPMRDRFARHYSDVAALWKHPARKAALARLDLLERVVKHKGRFFASGWASYETAKPGSFKFRPPKKREAELSKDYEQMSAMFMESPPKFSEVLRILGEAEDVINSL